MMHRMTQTTESAEFRWKFTSLRHNNASIIQSRMVCRNSYNLVSDGDGQTISTDVYHFIVPITNLGPRHFFAAVVE